MEVECQALGVETLYHKPAQQLNFLGTAVTYMQELVVDTNLAYSLWVEAAPAYGVGLQKPEGHLRSENEGQ